MNPSFEAEEVKVFGRMYQRGYIYKGLKPVYWCPHDETALAEAEIEYQDDPCTTVYVKFPMHDDQGKLGEFDKSKLFFVIWTTTIWTLPGNLAIALHPDESYALVKAPNGEVYILAEALVKKVMEVGKIEGYEIVATTRSFFENMLADHPSQDLRLVLAPNHHGLRYRLRPHRPASVPTTTRPASATAWTWWSPWTTRAATPTTPASTPASRPRSPTPSSWPT